MSQRTDRDGNPIVNVFLRHEDADTIDLYVRALRSCGYRKASRGAVVRLALRSFDLGSVSDAEILRSLPARGGRR